MEPTKQTNAAVCKHVQEHIDQGWDYDRLKKHIEEDFKLGQWEALQYLDLHKANCNKIQVMETIHPNMNRQQRRALERKNKKHGPH